MLWKHKKYKDRKVGIKAHLFFITLLLLFAVSVSYGRPSFDQDLVIAYHDVLKLKLEEGKERAAQVSPSIENLPLKLYTENLADMLELLLTEDRTLYNQKKGNEEKRLAKLQELQDQNAYKLFCEAEIKLQWAFVKLKFGDELSAAWSFRQAYSAITLNRESHPAFKPNQKTMGLLNVLLGAVPQKYHWLLNLLGIKGSTTEGMQQLSALAHSTHIFSLESKVLIGLINIYLMGNPIEAVNMLRKTASAHSDNKLIQYLYATVLMKHSEAEEALAVLKTEATLNESYLPMVIIAYLKGELYLQKGLYEEAIASYVTFLSRYKGENFVKDTYYKLFLAHWLNGDDTRAENYFSQARQQGATVAEADKYAAKQLALATYPEKTILKIRFATDGGYYEKAQALVDRYSVADFSSFQDQVEFIYRKARLFHKKNRTEEAIPYYLETIAQSGKQSWYFAPNAALQLGYIYAEKGKFSLAEKYFRKALTYKDHEYKNSIDNKAAAALQKMR